MQESIFSWKNAVIYSIEFIFVLNIIFVDVLIIQIFRTNSAPVAATTEALHTTPTSPIASPAAQITNTPTPTSASISNTVPIVAPLGVKEYFVPLGSGQGVNTDWTTLAGAQGYIDSTAYTSIKKVVFEVTSHTPTGNQTVLIRLFNITDGHPVWFSDLTYSGGDTQFLVSQPITLDGGNKVYAVQLKTQLGYQTIIDSARVHITLQ